MDTSVVVINVVGFPLTLGTYAPIRFTPHTFVTL